MTSVLMKRGNVDTDTWTECLVNMKAEIQVMCLKAKEHPRLPTNHQKPGERSGADPFSQWSEEVNPAKTWNSDF